jgi:hypothetical protein
MNADETTVLALAGTAKWDRMNRIGRIAPQWKLDFAAPSCESCLKNNP